MCCPDVHGKTALDYVKSHLGSMSSSSLRSSARLGAAMECSLLLHNAITMNDMKVGGINSGHAGVGAGAAPSSSYKRVVRHKSNAAAENKPAGAGAQTSQGGVFDPMTMEVQEEDCVYDVFCIHKPDYESLLNLPPLGGERDGNFPDQDAVSGEEEVVPGKNAPIIQVPGLHIDQYGDVITYMDELQQQHFVYDSDWSDLGGMYIYMWCVCLSVCC